MQGQLINSFVVNNSHCSTEYAISTDILHGKKQVILNKIETVDKRTMKPQSFVIDAQDFEAVKVALINVKL